MFSKVFENLRKATETNVRMQQQIFQRWMSLWPGITETSSMEKGHVDVEKLQKQWAEALNDMLKRQREVYQTSFQLGQENVEKALALGEAKTIEELQAKTKELWLKCLDSLRETNETQVREFVAATEKWLDLVGKPVA
ncbi:MAG: hypothetical protein ACFCD0_16930 [Gemmataceae bacterium]